MVNPLLIALDVPELDRAVELARRLEGEVGGFKVGLELFAAHGPAAVRSVAPFGPVFLDVKLHDIPTTVGRAARQLGRLGVAMLTVHASGGKAMVAAAVEGLATGSSGTTAPDPLVIAVTALTSLSDDDLADVGLASAEDTVPRLARLAVRGGAPGVVCAPRDLGRVRAAIGDDPVVITPGIRSAGSGVDDHARAATADEALRRGATYLVVGRPVVGANDPVHAARELLAEAAP